VGDSSVLSPVDHIWDLGNLEVSSVVETVVWSLVLLVLLVLGSVSEKLFVLLFSPGSEFVQTHLEASTIFLVVPGDLHSVVSEDSKSELVLNRGSV